MISFDDLLGATRISASGLSAERLRMEVLANNIANANSTRSANGGPFRRQDVLFAAVLDNRLGKLQGMGGVAVEGVVDDPSPFNRIFQPGHPDADAEGMVTLPNVHLPIEMVNLITASRGYEANLRCAQAFRQMADQALALGRS
jgi:flagellar basal-body rod protein FlgC